MRSEPSLEEFLRGQIAAGDFTHHDHVRMAFEMLGRYDFAEAVLHYSRALRAMVTRAGKPQAFNQTITVAFLSVIAGRMAEAAAGSFTAFAAGNPDLFDKALLRRWYRPEQLASGLASRMFVLPDPPGDRP
jgi:hypothetical protein